VKVIIWVYLHPSAVDVVNKFRDALLRVVYLRKCCWVAGRSKDWLRSRGAGKFSLAEFAVAMV
jgi:hypothetical protein